MDRFEISILRDFYGDLLTDKQNEMLKMRYDEDLSFGEIADATGVSRQAVLDSINKGEKHLAEYEEKLGCLDRQRKLLAILDEMEDGIAADDRDRLYAAVAAMKKIMED